MQSVVQQTCRLSLV